MKSNPLKHYFDNTCKIKSSSLKEKLFKFEFKSKTCEVCGIKEWQNQPAPLELHHINGNSQDNALENLQILCPNCHAQTYNYRASNQKRVVIKKTVEEIKEAVVSSYNIRQTLIKLGYAPQGGNYQRINEIKNKYNLEFRPMTEEERLIESENKRQALLKFHAGREKYQTEKKAKNGNEKIKITSRVTLSLRTSAEQHLEMRKVKWPSKLELLTLMWREPLIKVCKRYGVSDNAIRKWAKHYKIPYPPRGYWAKLQNGYEEECLEIKKAAFNKCGIEW